MNDKELHSLLLKLDFTPNDAKVYLSLLYQGTTTAGPVIKDTQLHRNIVYTSFDHLIAKKLVSVKTIKGRKRFSAADPSILISNYSDKLQAAKNAAKQIEKKLSSDAQEITTHAGNEEFSQLLLTTTKALSSGEEVLVLGAGGDEFIEATLSDFWDEYLDIVNSKNVKVKVVAYDHQRDAISTHLKGVSSYSVRYLEDSLANPAGIQVYPSLGMVFNIIYPHDENPVTVISIKSAALAQGYNNLFSNLWKIASR